VEPSEAVSVPPLELEPGEAEPVDETDSEGLLIADVVVDDCDMAVAVGMAAVFVSFWSTTEALDDRIDASVEAGVWTDEGVPVDATRATDDASTEEPVPTGDCEPNAAPLPKPVGRLYGQLVRTEASPGPGCIE